MTAELESVTSQFIDSLVQQDRENLVVVLFVRRISKD